MATFLPVPTYADPVLVNKKDPTKSSFNPVWLSWFLQIGQTLGNAGATSGAIQHNNLGGLQGGGTSERYHLTAAQNTGLTGAADTTLHFHAADRARANHTGTQASSTITGTTTNDNAAAGNLGEYVSAQLVSGSATSLTTATAKNVTSMSLTAGDWDVEGVIDYVLSAATTTDFKGGASSTSATFGAQDTFTLTPFISTVLSDTYGQLIPPTRFSLASTTTVYLVGQATFSAGTMTAYGTIRARRVR